jgi:hypothetical protein
VEETVKFDENLETVLAQKVAQYQQDLAHNRVIFTE